MNLVEITQPSLSDPFVKHDAQICLKDITNTVKPVIRDPPSATRKWSYKADGF